MNKRHDPSPGPSTLTAAENIEVTLHFEIGQFALSLGQLQTLQPGFVFKLDACLEKPVTIQVNQTTIGRGELVRVGDQLGVRILELDHASDKRS